MNKELPKGWIETSLLNIVEVCTGKKDANYAKPEGQYLFFTCAYEPLKSDDYSFEGEVLILPGNGVNVGEVFYYEGKFEAYQRTYIVSNIKIIPKYLFYHFKRYWKEIGTAQQYGSATNYIKIGNFSDYRICFPPPPEQQRIAAKLDTLFEKLDKIKTHLERIPQLLKDFRQSVLTQAVTGKLTEEWREGRGIIESSKDVKLIELLNEKPRNGYSPKGVEYVTNVKSLTLGATTSGRFDSSKIKYLDIEIPKKDSYLWLKAGDILIQRSNSFDYVGVSAIYDGEDDDFIYPDLMMKLKLKNPDLVKYVFYQLSSQKLRTYFRDNATGTAGNMPKINQGVVSNAPITLRSAKEQQEIVRRVESLFAKADKVEKQYQTLKEKIEQLPQAILTKAFRGELVEQLPIDGDARDLLEEIQKAKTELEKTNRTKTKRGKTRKLQSGKDERMVAEPEGRYEK